MDEKNKKIAEAFYEKCTLCLRDGGGSQRVEYWFRIAKLLVEEPDDTVDDYLISKYVVQFKNKLRLIRSMRESADTYVAETELYINHLEELMPNIDTCELQKIVDESAFSIFMDNLTSIAELYHSDYNFNDALPDIEMNGHLTSLFIEVELIAMTKNLEKITIILFEAIDVEYLKTRELITSNYLSQIRVL